MKRESPISVQAFEAAMRDDPEVQGVLYTGSVGRGTADRFSDLDIEVWVTDAAHERARAKLRDALGHLGEVRFFYYFGESATVTGFVGPGWQPVDISLHAREELRPCPAYAHARVIKDTDGVLARLVAASSRLSVAVLEKQARAAIEEAIDIQIYAARHNARGDAWAALGDVSQHCLKLCTLLARLRGHESFDFRHAGRFLSPAEQALLMEAWPTAPTRCEVRRAARALWTWTVHVWCEAETVLGQPLGVTVSDAELLAAVEQMYQ